MGASLAVHMQNFRLYRVNIIRILTELCDFNIIQQDYSVDDLVTMLDQGIKGRALLNTTSNLPYSLTPSNTNTRINLPITRTGIEQGQVSIPQLNPNHDRTLRLSLNHEGTLTLGPIPPPQPSTPLFENVSTPELFNSRNISFILDQLRRGVATNTANTQTTHQTRTDDLMRDLLERNYADTGTQTPEDFLPSIRVTGNTPDINLSPINYYINVNRTYMEGDTNSFYINSNYYLVFF